MLIHSAVLSFDDFESWMRFSCCNLAAVTVLDVAACKQSSIVYMLTLFNLCNSRPSSNLFHLPAPNSLACGLASPERFLILEDQSKSGVCSWPFHLPLERLISSNCQRCDRLLRLDGISWRRLRIKTKSWLWVVFQFLSQSLLYNMCLLWRGQCEPYLA